LQVDEIAILDLASSELEFFRSLRELVRQSADHIKSENMEELVLVLQEKQAMISQYNIILEEWNKIGLSFEIEEGRNNFDFWTLLFNALSAESSKTEFFSAKIKSLIEQIKTLAEELLKTEDDAQEGLNEYVKRLRTRISQISKGRDACKGYASASGSSLPGRSIS
jgi:flagellar hook-associated protein FlgK